MRFPRLTRRAERHVEILIPSDSAEYLEPRPHHADYRAPIEIEGHKIELGGDQAFRKPEIPAPRP